MRAGQCARRNVRHVAGRSRLGGMPSAFRVLAIVDRAKRWPNVLQRSLNTGVAATRILRRHPQDQTPNLSEHPRSAWSLPGVGHFRAISSRCHRRMVSGVTSVATSRSTPRRAAARAPPAAIVTHRPTAAGVPSVVLLACDSPPRRNAITSPCSRSSHPSATAWAPFLPSRGRVTGRLIKRTLRRRFTRTAIALRVGDDL